MRRARARRLAVTAVAITATAGTLWGCSTSNDPDMDGVVEKSFTDQHGRACTYILVGDDVGDGDLIDPDAENSDCDYPPSRPANGGGP